MKLTNRLQTIADLVEKNVVVGDIGTDHGYLIAYLVEKGIISKGIATDINEGPVKNCENTVKTSGIEDQVHVRLGGGLTPYKPGEMDTAVIAGMGGELIKDIIIESRAVAESVNTFILQPMTGSDVLRKWLSSNNYNITKEIISNEQDRYYEIMVVKHGHQNRELPKFMEHMTVDDALTYEIGFKMVLNHDYQGFINKKIRKYEMIKNQIKNNGKGHNEKLTQTEAHLSKLYEVIKCIQTLEKS